jgi:hypothetical protein
MTNKNNRPTLIPASYPALEREIYASLDFVTERETLMPDSGEQEDLLSDSVRADLVERDQDGNWTNCPACKRGRCNNCERD